MHTRLRRVHSALSCAGRNGQGARGHQPSGAGCVARQACPPQQETGRAGRAKGLPLPLSALAHCTNRPQLWQTGCACVHARRIWSGQRDEQRRTNHLQKEWGELTRKTPRRAPTACRPRPARHAGGAPPQRAAKLWTAHAGKREMRNSGPANGPAAQRGAAPYTTLRGLCVSMRGCHAHPARPRAGRAGQGASRLERKRKEGISSALKQSKRGKTYAGGRTRKR